VKLDIEPVRDPNERVDRDVASTLLDPGVVRREHSQDPGERLLSLARRLAQFLDSQAHCLQDCFRSASRHNATFAVVEARETESYKTSPGAAGKNLEAA
jgi:hypothetical protein